MSAGVAEVSPKYLAEAVSNAVPLGYKQTDVGVIPDDWGVSPLSTMTSLMTNGFVGTAKTHYTDSHDGVTYIQGYNVEENGFNFNDIKRVTPEFNKKNSKSCLREGDVLMVQTGDVGLVTIVPRELEGANCHALIISRFQKDTYDPHYFSYYLNSQQGRLRLKELETGTTMKHINVGDLLHFGVPYPKAKQEQTAIANALSDVDALISELEKLIAKKQAIKTATMQQLLTGRTRLPQFALCDDGSPKGTKPSELGEIPEDWDIEVFSSLAKPHAARVNPKVYGGGDLCVELEHVSSGTGSLLGYTETNKNSSLKSVFESGDVLFGKLRSYLRKYWLADMSGVCSTEIWVLKPEYQKTISKFIFYLVQTDKFIEAASEAYGTHMPRADWKVVGEFMVAIPSLKEQTAIATILSDMDAEIQALEQHLSKTRQIKQGMMQELLTGNTRLIKGDIDG